MAVQVEQKQLIVQQLADMTVTATVGGIPVICVCGDGEHETVMAVNFLRAGVPFVQMCLSVDGGPFDQQLRVRILLNHLQVTGERLYIDREIDQKTRYDKENPPVISLLRHVFGTV